MSSDYIPRLREELLRAGARGRTRRRVSLPVRPVITVGAVVALVAAVLVLMPGPSNDERPATSTVRLGYLVDPAKADIAAAMLRARLDAAGIRPAQVTPGQGAIDVVVPTTARAMMPALTQPGWLGIYDFEGSVIGGVDPVSFSKARARVASSGDAIAVRSETEPKKWFALSGRPPIVNDYVVGARVAADPSTREPVVLLSLDPEAQREFGVLTRKVARRGADQALGGDPLQTSQHLAIVVDDRIVSMPYVNWRENPDGIDGAAGVQLAGGLTPTSAKVLAAVLSAGPLPRLTAR